MTRLGASSSQDPRPRTGVPGFLLDRGRYRGFDAPEAQLATLPYDVNNRGQIVGIYSENTPIVKQERGRRHGYPWDRGQVTRIDVPGAIETGAFGINNRGQITGSTLTPSAADPRQGTGVPPLPGMPER
jgi:hypothetical protein